MDFDTFLNKDKLKDVINLISNNQKLSDRLVYNIMKENYDNENYWKYIIEKVNLTNNFILEYINEINFNYVIKYQRFNNELLTNLKFIKHICTNDYTNLLVQYNKLDCDILKYIILNDFTDNDFWSIISQYQILDDNFIREYDNKLDWKKISNYQNINLELITDYLDKIDWTTIPLNICTSLLINDNTIKLFDKYPIWNNIGCLKNLSNDILFNYFDKFEKPAIYNILNLRTLNEEQINTIVIKYIDDKEVWRLISSNQILNNEFIDKYIDKLDWSELSENHMFMEDDLIKYNSLIDYKKLSYNDSFCDEWLKTLLDFNITNKNINLLDMSFLKKYNIISQNIE